MWKKGTSVHYLVEIEIGAVTMENTMDIPLKVKNKTTI